ncbi:MAG: flippase [Chloroflexi bacterium]|nr:flippase [Chloroflexota bacterium]
MARAAAGTFALRVLATGATFALNVFVARLLGADGFGVVSYVIAWANLLAVPAVLGMDVLVMRSVAAWAGQRRWPEIHGLLSFSRLAVLAASLSAAAGASIIAVVIGDFRDPATRTLVLGMTLVPLIALIRLNQGAMRGLHYVVRGQLAELVTRPFATLVLVSAAAMFFGPALDAAGVMSAHVVAAIIALAFGVTLLRRVTPSEIRRSEVVMARRAWLISALPLLLIGGVQVANRQVDVVMVGSLAGVESAGIYTGAARAAELISFVLFAVNAALAPRVARLHAAGNTHALQILVTRAARYTVVISLCLTAGLVTFSGPVLALFGPEFVAGSLALTVLAVAQLLNAAAGSVGVIATMTGHARATALAVGTGLIINVLLNAALVPILTYNGAAIASAASLVTWNAILVLMLRRRVGLDSTFLGRPPIRDTT